MNVIESLKTYILDNINPYIIALSTVELPLTTIDSAKIAIDDVDTDKYLSNVMIYLIPDEATYERLTLQSDNVLQRVNVMIFVRKDTSANLITKLFLYNSAFKALMRHDPTIGNIVDDSKLDSQQYYQGVEGSNDIKAMEYNISLQYQEEY
jgi:hypothetical protein